MTQETDRTAGVQPSTAEVAADGGHQRIALVRWTCTTGSNMRSRGAVVVESGDHRWEGTARGDGPVEALYRAVDDAVHDVLTGHPRLLAYDVHAVAEGPDAAGRVTVEIAPPAGGGGARASGTYHGEAERTNIIAASVEAYIDALNRLLAEEHWAGATDSAGNWRAVPQAREGRPEYDPGESHHDTTRWFER